MTWDSRFRPGRRGTLSVMAKEFVWWDTVQMRVIFSLLAGLVLGFAATVLLIIASGLGLTGVATGILVRERPGWVENFYLDPSDLVVQAVFIGLMAVILFAVIARVLLRHRA